MSGDGRSADNGPAQSQLLTQPVGTTRTDDDIVAREFAGILLDAGFVTGFRAGWDACDDRMQRRFGLAVDAALDQPTLDELATARAVDNRPCPARCRNCSRCTRYAAAWRNTRIFGSPDYPGAQAEAELLARQQDAGQQDAGQQDAGDRIAAPAGAA